MLLLLLACHPGPPPDDTGDGVEHLHSPDPGTTTPSVDPRTSDALFTVDTLHTVEITLDDDAWDGLYGDPYTFVAGDVRVDGDLLPRSGIRLRGKYGSFRTITGKPKFKIEFNEYEDDQRYLGMKAIALNNEVVDCSYLKEPLGYAVFGAAGIPAPRTSFAQVRVNGEDYGLYVVVEVPDDSFLTRTYADPSGNLYDGKYLYYGDKGYQLLDFAAGLDEMFPLEEGTDVGHADVAAVSAAILAGVGTGDFATPVGAVVDLDFFHHFEAAEQWIGHVDGYAMNQNNYRVYFDPATQRMQFVPWDLDYAFIEDYAWGMSWSTPRGALAAGCWADPDCHEAQADAVDAVLADIDEEALLAAFDGWDALTLDVARDDPKRECPSAQVRPDRNALRDWVAARSAAVRATWGR